MSLEGRAALVTGGAKRIGKAIALELAGAGCDIAVHYRSSREEACEVVGQIQAMGRLAIAVSADLAAPESWPLLVEQAVEGLGRLDTLVNNASAFAIHHDDSIESFHRDHWEETLRVNLVAPAALCHLAVPHLRRSGRGRIVNLCDSGSERPWPRHLAYCSSKAGLVSLTRGLARGLAPDILVNGIAPGVAAFPEDLSADQRERLISRIPLQRAGTPEDVARLVRFLIRHGHYMTGEIIAVDGGRSLA